MAKLIALVLAATALVAHAQDNACPPNAQICGSEIIDKYKCDGGTMRLITPADNDPRNCHFFTDELGEPQARGAQCCAEGRCVTGPDLRSFCD